MDFSWDSIQPTENLILVPTAPLASLVQSQLLAQQPNHALRGSVVLDFDRFIEQLLAKADRSAPRLQDRERELLLLEVVRQLDQQGELQYFSYRPDHPGMMSLLSQAIGMLKLSGILPAILERAVEGLPAKDRDLASIYRRYQATISALGYQDMEDRFLVAAEILAGQPDRYLPGLRAVYGLYLHDLHPMQEKILDLLQLHMPDSRIDRRVARSHSPHAALRELTEHWSEQSQGPGLLSAIEGVTILQAPDPRREVAWMIKEVKHRMLSQGMKPWQVALVVREADRYGGYLVRELEQAGIPYHFSSKEPLLPHPVAQAVLLWLQTAVEAQERFDLLPFLRMDLLQSQPSLANRLASLWRVQGRKQNWDGWMADLDRFERQHLAKQQRAEQAEGEDDEDHVSDVTLGAEFFVQARTYLNHLKGSMASIPAEAGPAELTKSLLTAMDVLGLRTNLHNQIPFLGNEQIRYHATADAAWNATLACIESIAKLAEILGQGDQAWPIGDYFAELQLQLQGSAFRVTQGTPAGVVVATPGHLRGQQFELVGVIGMNEGAYPHTSRADWILGEDLRQRLANSGFPLPTIADQISREKRQMASVCASASQILFSYARSDEAGGPLSPSPYIHEMNMLAPAAFHTIQVASSELYTRDLNQAVGWGELVAGSLHNLWAVNESDRQRLARSNLPRLASQSRLVGAIRQQVMIEEGRSRQLRGNPYAGTITQQAALHDSLWKMSYSASAFNTYSRCPFQFYAGRLLGIRKPDEVSAELNPLDRGNLYHAILKELLSRGRNQLYGSGQSPEAVASLGKQMLAEVMDTLWEQPETVAMEPELWQLVKERLRPKLEAVVAHEAQFNAASGFKPSHLESYFELPWEIEPGKRIKIVGIIDRVDLNAQRQARVYDYKGGKGDYSIKSVHNCSDLQLPVYALALATCEQFEGIEPVSLHYHFVMTNKEADRLLIVPLIAAEKKPRSPTKVVGLPDLRAAAEQVIGQVFQEMLQGHFEPQPDKANRCEKCDYRTICRYHPADTGEEVMA